MMPFTWEHDEKVFTHAFEHAAIGMALVAPDGRWLEVNSALCELLGYTKGELLALSFQDITHPDDLDIDLKYFQNLLAGRQRYYRKEKRYIHKNQDIIYALLSVSLVQGDNQLPHFFITQVQDLTERKKIEDELERQAKEDALTGIGNRRSFYELSAREIARLARYNGTAVLLMLDIDHFKMINDRYGHAGGDEALKELTVTVQRLLRPFDIFGRVGGEEFAILLIQASVDMGDAIAERLRRAVSEIQITKPAGILRFTVSVGGVAFSGNRNSLDTLLHYADEALYYVKSHGRNAVRITRDASYAVVTEASEHPAGFVRLDWHAEYECGHLILDAQHRNILRVANDLLALIVSSESSSRIQPLVQGLFAELNTHLRTEERLLKAVEYPLQEEHQKIHGQLLKKAHMLLQRYEENQLEVSDLLHFIAIDFVYEHFLHEDKKYFAYVAR